MYLKHIVNISYSNHIRSIKNGNRTVLQFCIVQIKSHNLLQKTAKSKYNNNENFKPQKDITVLFVH